jgi:hypothetical protein
MTPEGSSRWKGVRDAILFFGGLALVGHEVIVLDAPRDNVLIFAGVMMGLIPSLRLDDWIRSARGGDRRSTHD